MSGSITSTSAEPIAATSCDHCALPVPAGLVDPNAELQFCCHGCRAVYTVLQEQGLGHYYELRSAAQESGVPAQSTDRSYEEFDDEAFWELYVRRTAEGLAVAELYLEGVHCSACVWLVERIPVKLAGIAEARLELTRSMARVTWDPQTVRLSAIARFLDSLGYPVHPYRGVRLREMRRREDRSMLIKIGVAGAVAGNVMMLSFALYGGMLHGIAPAHEALFRWSSLVISLPSLLFSASLFFRGAWGALRARALHMDVPIALGILAGFAWGSWNTIRGAGDIYFDSVTALIFLLLAGRFLQQRRQRSAADSAELIFSLTPVAARVVGDAGARSVALEALQSGMLVEVRAGESIPVDGSIESGSSTLDTSLLTGESQPTDVASGDRVHAGTVNLSSPIRVRVEAAGERTRVGRLMRMVEECSLRRAPVVRMADRISGWFVAAVLVLAGLTLAVWWPAGAGRALDHAIALLIVTCPCALGLATPLAVSAAIGRAGRAGILVKGGDALELLARRGRIFLDKTGTLTRGESAVVRFWGEDEVRPLVAALEANVSHPVARALARLSDRTLDAQQIERAPDSTGVKGRVAGSAVAVGSQRFIESECGTIPDTVSQVVEEIARSGASPVLVAVDGSVRAVAGIGDPLRPEARGTIDALSARGFEIEMLSGDHPRVAAAVGRELGLQPEACRGGLTPEDKLEIVQDAARRGSVVMVGDGVNDAGALSAATVGVSVHGGAEAAMAVADVFLSQEGIGSLLQLVEGARRTIGVIRRNLVFSLLYNVVGAGLALGGLINPLIAAVLMPLSSLTVITYSFRAKTF